MSDHAARLISVQGQVQGVFFRASCQDEAERLGVVGWARNESDGSVSVLAQGAPEEVAALERWCQEGPSHARVDSVTGQDADVDETLTSFETR